MLTLRTKRLKQCVSPLALFFLYMPSPHYYLLMIEKQIFPSDNPLLNFPFCFFRESGAISSSFLSPSSSSVTIEPLPQNSPSFFSSLLFIHQVRTISGSRPALARFSFFFSPPHPTFFYQQNVRIVVSHMIEKWFSPAPFSLFSHRRQLAFLVQDGKLFSLQALE